MSSYSEMANRNPKYRELKRNFKRGKVCAECKEFKPDQMTIDHIIPMWQFTGSYSDTSNWQVLCLQCHRIKTRQEGFGVGYIHEAFEKETITSSDETINPKWYSLRELLDATILSSVDIYIPTENYLKYLIDEWVRSEKQKKAVSNLRLNNPKLKSMFATKGYQSQNTNKLKSVIEGLEKGSPLSGLIRDDDSYLLVSGEGDGNFTKLNRREHYKVMHHYLTCQDTPYRMSVFPDGVPDSLADHAIYVNAVKTGKEIAAIAILGDLYMLEISAENATVEVIYNPETLKFAFSYKKR
jgi:hypothetical protein